MQTEIDYTQMAVFQACEMKYYLKFVLGLSKRKYDERDIDKEFGRCVHQGLAYLYKGEAGKIREAFDEFRDLPEESGEVHKTKANGISLLTQYVEHYADIDKDVEVLDVESLDKAELADGVVWLSKVDTQIRMRENIYCLEHKTTKKIEYSYFGRYNPNTQVSGQCFVTLRKFGQCSGVIINVLQSGWRKRGYRGEPAGFHCKFQREIMNRTPEQLEDFRLNAILWAERIAKKKIVLLQSGRASWGKNEYSCHIYRGCPYKEICMTSVGCKLDDEIVETLYEKADPFAYLKDGAKEKE